MMIKRVGSSLDMNLNCVSPWMFNFLSLSFFICKTETRWELQRVSNEIMNAKHLA